MYCLCITGTILKNENLLEFSNLGTYCQFDLFGTECSLYQLNLAADMPSDAQRMDKVVSLIEAGKEDRVLVAHDIHTKHRLVRFYSLPTHLCKCQFMFYDNHISFKCTYKDILSSNMQILSMFLILQIKFGGHGYSHILNNVLPKMKAKGVSQATIDRIMIENPKTWLAYKQN